MSSLLRASSILVIWTLIATFLLFGITSIFTKISKNNELDKILLVSSKNVLASPTTTSDAPKQILAAVQGEDARAGLVDQFLEKNNSPMTGSGKHFVQAADKYNLDWKLLPAIAFTESTLGKKTPFGTYNAFGWGIVDNTIRGEDFDSWEDAIFTVAQGLRHQYYNQGLKTLEEINNKYAGDENWDKKVLQAMGDILSL